MRTKELPGAQRQGLPVTRPRRRRWPYVLAAVGVAVAALLGLFAVNASQSINATAGNDYADLCVGGEDFYNEKQVTASVAAIKFGQDEPYFQAHENGLPKQEDAAVERTPYEWYGAYFPFTSAYADSAFVEKGCGNVEGWMGATIPSLLFTIGSALSTLLIAVYSWSTNPDLLNGLIAPIDCVVAGQDSASAEADIGLTFGAAYNTAGDAFANEGTCNTNGLRDTLFLQWWVLVFFFGALWMLWQAVAKKRTSQALIGALWMIGAAAGSLVFLWQPTFLATQANDLVSRINNGLVTTVVGATDGRENEDLCYLNPEATAVEDLLDRIGDPALINPDPYTQQMIDKWATGSSVKGNIGPRRASCILWKTLVFDAWTQGQFGDYAAAVQPLSPDPVVSVSGDGVGDEKLAQQRADQIQRLERKFPHLDPSVVTTLGIAQLDATVLDHDEVKAINEPIDGSYLSVDVLGVDSCYNTATDDFEDGACQNSSPAVAGADFRAIHDQVANSPANAGWAPIWSGRAPSQRYAAAITAVVGALIGGVVVFILGFLNILYQIGMLLLIVVAPLILLVGLHPGFGRRITIRWLEALLSTVTKRILIGVLLVILIAIYSAIYVMDVGWLQKTLLLAAVGIGLLLYRKQLTQMMGAVNFGGGGGDSYGQPAQQAQRRGTRAVSSGAGATGAALLGGAGLGVAAAAGARAATSRTGGMNVPGSEGVRSGRAAAARSAAKRDRKRRERRKQRA